MKKTLRSKLLFWFLVFSSFTLITIIIFNGIYFRKKTDVTGIVNDINELHVRILKSFMHLDDFFALETSNERFFETGNSKYLKQFHENLDWIQQETERLAERSSEFGFEIEAHLVAIRKELDIYHQVSERMMELIMQRGFKDYGLEGEMRGYVHILENFDKLNQTQVLSLRRHEKDYIIRNQEEYVEKLNQLGALMQQEVIRSSSLKDWEKDSILSIVGSYLSLFNQIVELDRQIGIKDNSTGFMSQLNQLSTSVENEFELLISQSNQKKEEIFALLELHYALFFALLVSVSFLLSWMISKRITSPLRKLTQYIGQLIENRFQKVNELELDKTHHEIEVLNDEFMQMLDLLQEQQLQRDKAEGALRESELRYRELAEMLPISIYEADLEGNISYVNKSWLENFGYQWTEVEIGMNLSQIMLGNWKESMKEGEIHGREFSAIRQNRTTFSALVYTDRILKDNKIVGYRGILVDIEDRKRYIEELKREKLKAEESDRLKSAFLANMSHEIRTPMNAIIGFSDLLTKLDLGSAKKIEFIKQIKNSGNLLLNLIDDIIDIAKIEAGEIKIQPGFTYVNQLIDELELTFSELIKKENKGALVEIHGTKTYKNRDFAILSDPIRLKQVLSNLIGNSIKFTEKGVISFGYRVSDEYLEFFVKDTGIGLSEEQRKVVFERFRQVEDTKNRKYGGTGLGLAISRHLVELLGGNIWLESEPFKGSTFYFTIPNKVVGGGQKDTQLQIENDFNGFDWTRSHLLIVEDDLPNAQLLIAALESTGIQIDCAGNGQEAISFCRGNKTPDLVLMDIQMPVMNGLDATRILKEEYPSLPIIAQTAYAMSGEKEKCLAAGCDDYISKPINISLLKSKIYAVMKSRKETASYHK